MALLPSANAQSLLLQNLIQAREDLGLGRPSRQDAQVDVYVCGLLTTILAWPRYIAWAQHYLRDYDFEIALAADDSDEAHAFRLFKTNADSILISLGVFRALPKPRERSTRSATRESYVGRGKAYYVQAASCRKRIDRQTTARVEVLESLATCFETYVRILDRVRSEYLNLRTRISPGAFQALESGLGEHSQTRALAAALDALLDTWNRVQAGREEAGEVQNAVARVRALDPTFCWPLSS
jgi:hypothetical protein